MLDKIVRRAEREGYSMQEAMKYASFRIERSENACKAKYYTDIYKSDHPYKPHMKSLYIEEDVQFGDAGDLIGDDEYKPAPPADTRYNLPKLAPTASADDVENAILHNPIYSAVRDSMFGAQNRQVAYGLDKYPEPLNASTWTIMETIDHIISETVDKLHYLTMLKIKLQQEEE